MKGLEKQRPLSLEGSESTDTARRVRKVCGHACELSVGIHVRIGESAGRKVVNQW
jgi:hypothetical protein